MVFIFYCVLEDPLPQTSFNYLLEQLPPSLQNQVLKFRRCEDQQRSLLGKILLKTGLNAMSSGSYSLSDLKYTQYLKPYFDDMIDFNISHSGVFVMCALSKTVKLGVDIEEIRDVPLADFENFFSEKEWNNILLHENTKAAFYSAWTRKESFIKAIGTGLHITLNEIDCTGNQITWNDKDWFFHEIKLDHNHIAHLCANIPNPQIIIKHINFPG